jgi:pilus assembly protein Flp/PilA
MGPMGKHLFALYEDESGASAVEYGLIAAIIVIAMIAGMKNFAGAMENKWNFVSTETANVMH